MPSTQPTSTAPRVSIGPAGTEWDALVEEIRACRRCPLHRTRTHVVVYRGGPRPNVVFVGESPGAEEDRVGLPFVGRSGRLLDRAIAEVGLDPALVGILNLLKCRPPENRFDPDASETCRPYLERQLALLQPQLLVTLGARALEALVPGSPPVSQAAGRPTAGAGRVVFPLLHPAAPLHAPRLREQWNRDVAALRRFLDERERQNPIAPGTVGRP